MKGHLFNLPLRSLDVCLPFFCKAFLRKRRFPEGNSQTADLLWGISALVQEDVISSAGSILLRIKMGLSAGVPFEASQPRTHLTGAILLPGVMQHWMHAGQWQPEREFEILKDICSLSLLA